MIGYLHATINDYAFYSNEEDTVNCTDIRQIKRVVNNLNINQIMDDYFGRLIWVNYEMLYLFFCT